jgi:hypothetical protein
MPIIHSDGNTMTDAELVRAYRVMFGITEEDAKLIIAMERGEIQSDIIIVDENGNEKDEIPRPVE